MAPEAERDSRYAKRNPTRERIEQRRPGDDPDERQDIREHRRRGLVGETQDEPKMPERCLQYGVANAAVVKIPRPAPAEKRTPD